MRLHHAVDKKQKNKLHKRLGFSDDRVIALSIGY